MILDRILEHKRAELRHKQSRGYLAELKGKIRDQGPVLPFAITLEATNHNSRTLRLYDGMPIAQIVFETVDKMTEGYQGKYQDQTRGATEPR